MRTARAAWRLCLIAGTFASLGLSLAAVSLVFRSSRHRRRSRVVQRHMRLILRALGLRIQLRSPMPDAESYLLLANHVSYLDIIAISSLTPISFMAKAEVRQWPILGHLARMANSIFVDRNSIPGRIRALRELKKGLQNGPYCVFPEGTTSAAIAPAGTSWYRGNVAAVRNSGGRVATAHSRPIYAMGLHYQDQERLAWIDDDELLPHLWSLLQRTESQLLISIRLLEEQPSFAATSSRALHDINYLCRSITGQKDSESVLFSCQSPSRGPCFANAE